MAQKKEPTRKGFSGILPVFCILLIIIIAPRLLVMFDNHEPSKTLENKKRNSLCMHDLKDQKKRERFITLKNFQDVERHYASYPCLVYNTKNLCINTNAEGLCN